jgi:hypothetical protein
MTTTPAPLRAATEEVTALLHECRISLGLMLSYHGPMGDPADSAQYRAQECYDAVVAHLDAPAPVAHRPAESELLEALKALLASDLSIIPPFNAGREAQDAWADMRAKARNDAAEVIAKYQGARNEQR